MESNILTALFLPLALGIIMLGMGLSLTIADFKRVAIYPKATIIGLSNQLILLPLIAFGILYLFPMKPELAVGFMVLAACPGGATSNLLSHLAKGDTALSITLTAISSVITVFTIPLIINYSMEVFLGEGLFVKLPVLETMGQIFIVTVIPVSIGMWIKSKKPKLAERFQKPVKIASAIFIVLIILGAILKERENLLPFFAQVGLPAFFLNLVTLLVGFGSARLLKLNGPQSASISIESGIQNGTLAIAIATSSVLLNNPQMAIPPAVYSLIMFGLGGLAVLFFSSKKVRHLA